MPSRYLLTAAVIAVGGLLGWLAASGHLTTAIAQDERPSGAAEVLPHPDQPFQGKIGRTAKESTPDFPKAVEAPKGAPNVLLIMTDDVGWGASVHVRRADPYADL